MRVRIVRSDRQSLTLIQLRLSRWRGKASYPSPARRRSTYRHRITPCDNGVHRPVRTPAARSRAPIHSLQVIAAV